MRRLEEWFGRERVRCFEIWYSLRLQIDDGKFRIASQPYHSGFFVIMTFLHEEMVILKSAFTASVEQE